MGCVGLFDTEGLVLHRGQDVVWGVWDCLILKNWCCTSGCAVGCVGLFDTEGLVLHRGQDVVWGVWDCLILKDWCCTGCGGVCGTV